MAASGHGIPLLLVASPLQWLVNEHILAEWRHGGAQGDRRHLGTLSQANSASTFSLSIGHSPTTFALLIAFHIHFKIRPSTSSKPKHMFLVLPTEALDLDRSEDGLVSETCNTNAINEATLSGLRKAGLAEALEEDGSQRLIKISFRLKSPGYVIMPQASVGRPIRGTPLKLLHDLRSLSQSISFDAYLRFSTHAQASLERVHKTLRQRPLCTPTIHVESMFQGLGAVNVWQQYALDDDKARSDLPGVEPPSNPSPPPPAYPDLVPPASLPNSPPLGPEYESASSSDCSPSSTQAFSTPQLPSPRPAVLIPRSDAGSRILHSPSGHTSPSPSRRDSSVAVSETPLAESLPPSRKRQRTASPSPATTSHRTSELAFVLSRWLEWAFSHLPRAHEHFRDEVLALGRAARDEDVATFADVRAECTARLLFMVVDGGRERDLAARDLEDEVKAVVRYVNDIHALADTLVHAELFRMAEAARRRDGRPESFDRCKALCITKVCVTLQ